jgi:photosystem II stability/assembly factor-like uncharacterized protein
VKSCKKTIAMKNFSSRIITAICLIVVGTTLQAQWTLQYNSGSGAGYSHLQMLNSNDGYASDFKYVYKTSNGGTNWSKIDSTTLNNGITDFFALSVNEVYVLYTGGSGFASYMKSSSNGGTSWTTSASFGTTTDFFRNICFTTSTTGFVVGNNSKIYKTTNGGTSWTLYTVTSTTNLYAIQFVNATTGYVTGDNSAVYKTTNGGTSWTNLNISFQGSYSSLKFLTVDTGLVGSMNGIYRTYNGGSTWTNVYSAGVNTIDYASSDTVYSINQGGFAIVSHDKGTTWDSLNSVGNGLYVGEIDFLTGTTGYAAANGLNIYYTNTGAWGCPVVNFSATNPDTVCTGMTFNLYSQTNYFTSITSLSYQASGTANVQSSSNFGFGGYVYADMPNASVATFSVILNGASVGCPNDTDVFTVNAVTNNYVPNYTQMTTVDSVCVGDTLHAGTGAYAYAWKSMSNQVLSSGESLIITSAMINTQITLWVTTCAGTQYQYLFLVPGNCTPQNCSLTVSAGNDHIYCGTCGFMDTLIAIPSYTSGVTVSWSPTTNLYSPTSFITGIMLQCGTNTNYVVTATDASGCVAKDTVYVLAVQPTNQTNYICGNQSVQLIQNTGAGNYSWSGSSIGTISGANHLITVTQQDTITGIAYFPGCALTSLYQIIDTCSSLPPCNFVVDAGSTIFYCAGSPSNVPSLNPSVAPASSNYIYQWWPSTGLSSWSIANPTVSGVYNQTYTLTVIDTVNNCSASDTVLATSLPYMSDTLYNCNNSPVTIYNPPGAYYYQWMGGFNPQPGSNVNSTVITTPGSYYWAAFYNGCAVTNGTILIDSCGVQIPDVWPGDCNYDLTADYIDFLNIAMAYSNTGAVRPGASINWNAQPMTDWGTASYITDDKHSDCDGNGLVDTADINAILQNYNNTHPFRIGLQPYNATAADLYLVANKDTAGLGETVTFSVMLGTSALPVDSIYAIAYQLKYEANLTDSVGNVDYITSWLGTPGVNEISLEKQLPADEQIDCGVGGNNKVNRNGFGQIGELNIVVTTDNLSGIAVLNVDLQNVYAITASGNSVALNLLGDSVVIDENQPVGIGEAVQLNALVNIYPNPAKDEVNISTGNLEVRSLRVYDLLGNLVTCEKQPAGNNVIRLNNLTRGMYNISILTDKGVINKKLTVQ